jgi:hypothetical protein
MLIAAIGFATRYPNVNEHDEANQSAEWYLT